MGRRVVMLVLLTVALLVAGALVAHADDVQRPGRRCSEEIIGIQMCAFLLLLLILISPDFDIKA
jgi:hypothetical protein